MPFVTIHEDELHVRALNQTGEDAKGHPIFEKREDGTNEEYVSYIGDDPDGGLVQTGPVAGVVRLKSGKDYDVTPRIIGVAAGDGGRVAHHIAKMHEASGRLAEFQDGDPLHTCTDLCGGEGD